MKPPGFWTGTGRASRLAGLLLSPMEPLTAALTARRLRRAGWDAPVPVVCCGNVGVGGAGKTTLALDLVDRIRQRGIAVHCLTRGYGGSVGAGPLLVDPQCHDAALVGDEALLLAGRAPCWVGSDRAASGRAALQAGAQLLLMDDGLQNPGLIQDFPLLTIDGAVGFGNGRLLPAGPLREPIAVAAARTACAVLIGPDRTGALRHLPPGLAVLQAELRMDPHLVGLRGRTLFAFAGIARPGKFFDSLEALGLTLVGRRGFPDHHFFTPTDLAQLRGEADRHGAALITTPKDAARLGPARCSDLLVAGVSLHWRDQAACDGLIDRIVGRP
jgi:tetraacyldisaccharide 4'-kinase